MKEQLRTTYFSTFAISPQFDDIPEWRLFTYGRSQIIPKTTIIASREHTNMLMGWHLGVGRTLLVHNWLATASCRSPAVHDWARHTSAALFIGDKLKWSLPFIDLLDRPAWTPFPIDDWAKMGLDPYATHDGIHPHIKERMSFEVLVQSTPTATARLVEWLQEERVHHEIQQVVDQLVKLSADIPVDNPAYWHVQRAIDTTASWVPKQQLPLTFTVHLEGLQSTTAF